MTGENMETKFKTEYIYLLIQKYTRKYDIDYFLVIWQWVTIVILLCRYLIWDIKILQDP